MGSCTETAGVLASAAAVPAFASEEAAGAAVFVVVVLAAAALFVVLAAVVLAAVVLDAAVERDALVEAAVLELELPLVPVPAAELVPVDAASAFVRFALVAMSRSLDSQLEAYSESE